jgi:hypothetical protein
LQQADVNAVVQVLSQFKDNQMADALKDVSDDEVDVLMKYLFKFVSLLTSLVAVFSFDLLVVFLCSTGVWSLDRTQLSSSSGSPQSRPVVRPSAPSPESSSYVSCFLISINSL